MTTASDSELKKGFAGTHDLWSDQQFAAAHALLKRMVDEKLEVMRISFADQHGILRGKTITVSGLKSALRDGITMTSSLLFKDTSHKTVFPLWQEDSGFGAGAFTGASDVLMLPDPDTFKVLPWSPHSGWLLADLYFADGRPVPFSTRAILKKAVQDLNAKGYEFIAGLEVEFHVFKLAKQPMGLSDAGQPGSPPEVELTSQGYQYLTEDRYDQMEDIFDLIRRNGEAMGLPVRSLEVEFGPSQCEVTFDPADAMTQADNMILFRSMVKQVCRRAGYHATFMCRPRFADSMASGWHLHQSLVDVNTGENQFIPQSGEPISDLGLHWIAGLLAHARESCLFSTPTINGYKRYRPFALAPDRIQWGQDNRGAMIRCLAKPGDKASRVENRVGEPAANPYLYMASQILSGMDGIENKLVAPKPVSNPYDNDAEILPVSLIDALGAFKDSRFYREKLGAEFIQYMTTLKEAEWNRYLTTVSEWEEREYFSTF